MDQDDVMFVVALVTTVILAFLTGVYSQKTKHSTVAGFCALGCIFTLACAFFLREKSGNGQMLEIKSLPLKTHWEVLVKASLNEKQYGAIIKNPNTGRIVAFTSKEDPPAEFVVEKKGIPGLRKKTMTPVESDGHGKEKEKK